MEIVNIHNAKTNLSSLIARVLKGEKIIIAKGGKPLVRLEKIKDSEGKRIPGKLKNKIRISPDFDNLPPDFDDYLK